MPTAYDGFARAIISGITGAILSIIIKEMFNSLYDNDLYGVLFSILIFAIGLFILLHTMNYWGIFYTVGWFAGLIFIYYSMIDLFSPIEIIANVCITVFYLSLKISRKI